MGKPARMGEISGSDNINTFDGCPGCQAVQVAGLAGGAGVEGVDVEVGNKGHGVCCWLAG